MSKFRALTGAVVGLLFAALAAPALESSASTAPVPQVKARTGYARVVPPKTTIAKTVPFDLLGHVSTQRVKRRVVLEQKVSRGKWVAIGTVSTDRRGKFVFPDVRLTSSTRLRGHLPAYSTRIPAVAGGPRTLRVLPEITTKAQFIRVREQAGRLAEMPAVNQQGALPASPRNDSVVSAQFDPPVPGRRVLLEQRDKNGDWVKFAVRRADASGFAIFNVPTGATYRAIAKRFKGVDEVRTKPAHAQTRSLMFEDTFDAPTLDTKRWYDFTLPREHPDSLRTCALTHPSQRSVGEGVLRLGIGYDPTMAGQDCNYPWGEGTRPGPYLYQSQLSTVRSFRFTHGFAASRIKFSRSAGRHAGFWIQTDSKVPGDPSRGAEIDVVEFFGDLLGDQNRIGAYIHHLDADGAPVRYGELAPQMADMRPPGDTWWDSFHVFSVEWTASEYIFRVDGHEYYREDRGVSSEPQWLNLSAIVSDYEIPYITPENIDEESQVDWVRVWSL